MTVWGDCIRILDPGLHNRNAGPDFEFAKLQIGDTLWSGHVEMHISAKEWLQHKHHLDERYNSTVLHVVWTYDTDAVRHDGTLLPVLQLKDYVNPAMVQSYLDLMNNLNWIPCERHIKRESDSISYALWSERMIIERLEYKCLYIERLLKKSKYHWEKVMLMVLGRAFGMKVNAEPFEVLMEKLDTALLFKYRAEPLKLEALLFGTSGLLPTNPSDPYTKRLCKEFLYLQKIHGIKSLSRLEWKFHRMRPYNFPTFRLAQMAAICAHEVYWFDKICKTENLDDIFESLENVHIHDYWQSHFRFDVAASAHSYTLSDAFITHILINCFIPVLFAYGRYIGNEKYKEKAFNWLCQLPKENNAITKRFAELGWKHENAAESQGFIHMKKEYCDKKKCLSCAIGLTILKTDSLDLT